MIIITDTFNKNLSKIKSITLQNIISEVKKHNSGLNNFIEINNDNGNKIYKGYLLSKKVRILVYFENIDGKFIPFYLVKKETKYGNNITSDLSDKYFNQLYKCIEDIDNKKFKII